MDSRIIIIVLALALLLGDAKLRARENPNIIVILADDLGYGDVGCFNPESKIATPYLDRLAAEGIRFSDAHSPSTVCTPSRYGLLTGRLCFRTGTTGVLTGVDGPLIETGRTTLASMLGRHGYRTACVGKWHVGMTFFDKNGQPVKHRGGGIDKVKQVDFSKPIANGPLDVGFNYFFGTACCPTTDWLYAYIENDRVTEVPSESVSPETNHWLQYEHFRTGLKAPDFDFRKVDTVFLKKSIEFINQHVNQTPDRPFFLYHCTQTAHLPAMPDEPFVGKSEAGPLGDFIVQFDDVVGQLMAALDQLGIADDTLVIVSSDNGPEIVITDLRERFGHDSARPWRGMKRDNWEGGHRVPFIARWPGKIEAGIEISQTICLTDLMATFAAIVGHELAQNSAEDSFNLLPPLLGHSTTPEPIRRYTIHHTMNNSLAIRHGNWKLLAHQGSGGNRYDMPRLKPYALANKDPAAPFQLYDLSRDPGETKNLFNEQTELAITLKRQLDRFDESGRSR